MRSFTMRCGDKFADKVDQMAGNTRKDWVGFIVASVSIYIRLWNVIQEGGKVIIRDGSGNEQEVVLP